MYPLRPAAATLLLLAVAACGSSDGGPAAPAPSSPSSDASDAVASATPSGLAEPAAFPMTITRCGHTTTLTGPPKVLVEETHAAAIIAEAGGNTTGRVVALAADGDQPLGPASATLDGVPRISPTNRLGVEAVIGQEPDLIVAHDLTDSPPDQLEKAGIQSLVVNVCCDTYAAEHGGKVGFDAIYDDITLFGTILGTKDAAAKSVTRQKQVVQQVQQDARGKPDRTVAFVGSVSGGQFFTYGQPSIAQTQIDAMGMTNAFADLDKRGAQISSEAFVARDPDVLVLGYDGKSGGTEAQVRQALSEVPGASSLKAVKDGHVIVLSNTYLLSRAVDGTKLIADQINAYGP